MRDDVRNYDNKAGIVETKAAMGGGDADPYIDTSIVFLVLSLLWRFLLLVPADLVVRRSPMQQHSDANSQHCGVIGLRRRFSTWAFPRWCRRCSLRLERAGEVLQCVHQLSTDQATSMLTKKSRHTSERLQSAHYGEGRRAGARRTTLCFCAVETVEIQILTSHP